MPSLNELHLNANELPDLPSSFIHAVVSHPTLETLALDWTSGLGCSHDQSTPCSIDRLLSQLYLSGSSSPLVLRSLQLVGLELRAECCGPALERVLSLGSKGPQNVSLLCNSNLSPHARTLIRTISRDNFYIQWSAISGLDTLRWKNGEDGLTGRCADTLDLALEGNKRLEKETPQVAIKLLKLSRIIFLGCPARLSSSSELVERPRHFRLLDLPSELVQMVLSLVPPETLSNRQIGSVLRHAVDRTTLLPRIVEPDTSDQQAVHRRTRAQSRLDREPRRRLPFREKEEFLKEAECERYDL